MQGLQLREDVRQQEISPVPSEALSRGAADQQEASHGHHDPGHQRAGRGRGLWREAGVQQPQPELQRAQAAADRGASDPQEDFRLSI